eukprot:Em0001g3587a
MGEDTERRASSSFLSSSRSSLQLADSRRQEGAAGTCTDVNVQLLAAIKSLQDQVADLQAKSTQAVAATQQCNYSQRCNATLEKPMQWDTSLGFSSPENMLVTAEIATDDRFLLPWYKKLQIRKATCLASTTLTPEQRDQLGAVLHVEYMSTEKSAEESGEDECMGERHKKVKPSLSNKLEHSKGQYKQFIKACSHRIMDITAEVRSLENMDAKDGGVGEGGDVVRVDDGGAGDAVVRGPGGIDGGGAGGAFVRGPGGIDGGGAGDAVVRGPGVLTAAVLEMLLSWEEMTEDKETEDEETEDEAVK